MKAGDEGGDGDGRKLRKVLYTAAASASDRQGRVASSDGNIDLPLAVPTELGGSGDAGTNPEQLFAAGYASCFASAVTLVGRGRDQNIDDLSVAAKVGLGPSRVSRGFGIEVELTVSLPHIDREEAEGIVARAERACPYSNATRGNIDLSLVVESAEGRSTVVPGVRSKSAEKAEPSA